MRKNKFPKLFTVILLILFIFSMAACNANTKTPELIPGSSYALALSDTNYADKNNWISFGGDKNKGVDVFAIYPTVTTSAAEADLPYVRLDSRLMLNKASAWLEKVSGTVAESGNIYAPLYRQLNGTMLDNLTNDTFASYTNATPREDIFAAFDYFLVNINKGERPFIIFGHSQGAQLAIELATTFLGSERYYKYNKNHIITYAIGCSVVESQIASNPNLKFSESKDDTGVIVSWNTTAPSEVANGSYAKFGTWKPGALMTNPVTWEANETLAHASKNKASRVGQPDGTVKLVEGYANAVVDKEHNVLLTVTVDELKYQSTLITVSKFHAFDIDFYHDSIKQNVKERIAAFRLK